MSKETRNHDLVAILSDLIALPSPYPPGTSVEICAYAAKRLKKAGYKVEIATKTKGVDNVVARLKGKGKGPVDRLQRPCRHGGRGRARQLEERSLQGAGQGRAGLWAGRRQLQGQHGGADLARRGDRPPRRPAEGRAHLHLRGRRGESRARRHGIFAQERPRAARRADPGRADREQPDRGRARRDVGQAHDQGQGRARRQPGGRRQRHPAHDAAGRRAAGALRQGPAQAREGRHEVDGQCRHVPWRPQHQRRALGLHRRDRPPPAAQREGEGRLQGAEGRRRQGRRARRACTRSSS